MTRPPGLRVTVGRVSPPSPAGPPRTHIWRPRPGCLATLDVVAACVCAVIIFGVLVRAAAPYRLHPGGLAARLALPPLLAVCLAVPVALRRRAPVPSFAVALAACLVIIAFGGQITAGPILPLALVIYMVAATSALPLAAAALGAALAVLAVQGLMLSVAGFGSGNAVAGSLVLIICWVVGYGVRQRRAYAVHLREQAASAAVTEERLRIARELHDVVAHSMTVVAVQAGFGEYVFDSQPAQAKAALAAIQTVTRDALTDMQRLLGVLRQAAASAGPASPTPAAATGATAGTGETGGRGAPAPLVPAPGLADLDRLVSATAGAGVQVDILRSGEARQIPPGTDLSAFRIVQEALTNVVKHSGATRCMVAVDYGPALLTLEITDPGPCPGTQAASLRHPAPLAVLARGAPVGSAGGAAGPAPASGAGHGLVGMAERVSLCGGQFSAGPLPDGGFGVRAHLPLPAGAAAAPARSLV
jgi:signal transduction histidine kinase